MFAFGLVDELVPSVQFSYWKVSGFRGSRKKYVLKRIYQMKLNPLIFGPTIDEAWFLKMFH